MKEKRIKLKPIPASEFDARMASGDAEPIENPESLFRESIRYLEQFAVGKYFWFIADLARGTASIFGGMPEQMLPVSKSAFIKEHPKLLFENTHPEDLPCMFAFSKYWVGYVTALPEKRRREVRPTIYLRMKDINNAYRWVMTQFAHDVFDSKGNLVYGLTVITDISHIKTTGVAMMSILDIAEKTCSLFHCNSEEVIAMNADPIPRITDREMEILRMLSIGYSSKQMASLLNIAVNTIDNHRQSLLKKTNCRSTGELVAYGINTGFI